MSLDARPVSIVSYLGSPHPCHDDDVERDGASAGSGPLSGPAHPLGAALALANVVCRAGTAGPAAAGVSFEVPPGQSAALYSRPASTATDLLDVVAGLRRAAAGQVCVDGAAVHRLRGLELNRYRRDRGLLSMRFPLVRSLSVAGNVLAPQLSRRIDAGARERATRLLAFTGAAAVAAHPVESLPAEQQWRVLIARALMPAPRLVLAEDPAAGLDAAGTAAILDVLMEAHALLGFTLLMTITRRTTAGRCQRLVSLLDGAIAEDMLIPDDDDWTSGRVDRIG